MSGLPSVAIAHTIASVTTASSIALAANAERSYLLIQNASATESIYLSFGVPAVASAGINLDAGGSFEMGPRYGNLDIRVINAVHAGTGTHNLLVSEG